MRIFVHFNVFHFEKLDLEISVYHGNFHYMWKSGGDLGSYWCKSKQMEENLKMY